MYIVLHVGWYDGTFNEFYSPLVNSQSVIQGHHIYNIDGWDTPIDRLSSLRNWELVPYSDPCAVAVKSAS